MTLEHFGFWLQGFVELNGDAQPTRAQWKMITEHLATVFTKVTPPLAVAEPSEPLNVEGFKRIIEEMQRNSERSTDHPVACSGPVRFC